MSSTRADEAHTQVPRYRLHLGQELVYHGKEEWVYGADKLVASDTWRVWVVRENPDGSWRLIFRHGTANSQFRGANPKRSSIHQPQGTEKPENAILAWCDLFPDGRVVENDSLGFRLQPSTLLPRLPRNQDEAIQGWKSIDPHVHQTSSYRMLATATTGRCSFELVRQSPLDVIYGAENHTVLTFDTERGWLEKKTSTGRQTYGFDSRGTGSVEFVEVRNHPSEITRKFAEEAAQYFKAQAIYEKTCERTDLSADDLRAALDQASGDLQNLAESLQVPVLKRLVEEQLTKQEKNVMSVLAEAAIRQAVLGTPSEDWTATDLAGRTHALIDYRGKVVVLDFWYRGCGWCIRALPQIKEVVSYFEGQPVVVFGMNTDSEAADALFVVENMELTYPNLKAAGLRDKYKFRGFPALIILDQEGVIRDMHLGYSPHLKQEVIKSVEQLLTAKP